MSGDLIAQPPDDDGRAYARHRERAGRRQRELSESGRDIGAIPPIADPARRMAAEASFRVFCETYFPRTFCLAWSRDHLRVIARTERVVVDGGQSAIAMPRGSGKTALVLAAVLWAVLCGSRRFVVLIAATATKARELLEIILAELECNELLLADFPEVLYPIARLDRQHNRAKGQKYQGQHTRISIARDRIVLPTIPGSKCSASIIAVAGLTGGNIRGKQAKGDDGATLRPDLAVTDDPQTAATARSRVQNKRREDLLAGDVLGMAGPGQRIAAIACVTVIQPGDMADKILDRKEHPEWQGERTRMINTWPARMDLWEEYARIRADGLRAELDAGQATAFYAANRAEMDRGADVPWPERKTDEDLSALQHAMDLFFDRGKQTFFAEYQNDPQIESTAASRLTVALLLTKRTRLARGQVPDDAHTLSGFVDVHDTLLYWSLYAWSAGFGGGLIGYGTFPEQRRSYFTLEDASYTLADAYREAAPEGGLLAGPEAGIRWGLGRLVDFLLAREYRRADGTAFRVQRLGIDANYARNIVYKFCADSAWSPLLLPSHGRYYGAKGRGFSYKAKPGERVGRGLPWRIPIPDPGEPHHISWDANFFKSLFAARLATPQGDRGSLTLHEGDHTMLMDHFVLEKPERIKGPERTVDEWQQPPGDSHLFDCGVGAMVMGAERGVAIEEMGGPAPTRKVVRWSDVQKRKRLGGS